MHVNSLPCIEALHLINNRGALYIIFYLVIDVIYYLEQMKQGDCLNRYLLRYIKNVQGDPFELTVTITSVSGNAKRSRLPSLRKKIRKIK